MPYFDVRKLICSVLAGVGLALSAPALAASKSSAKPATQKSASARPASPTAVTPSATNRAPLDTFAVRKLYLDGDFEPAIDKLETTLRYGSGFTHGDSVFIFKHLGVMYAAKYETREKGKLYMHKLLEVDPTARIMDMYASDMIYMIFKNIQDEFNSGRPLLGEHRPQPQPQPQPQPLSGDPKEPKPPRKERSYAWLGWTAGAVAAAGGIALGFHMLEEEQAAARKENVSND